MPRHGFGDAAGAEDSPETSGKKRDGERFSSIQQIGNCDMNVRKVVAGSVLAAGLGVAGVFGAGTASAAPGISYSDGGANDFGMGDNTATGAQAKASEGNQALAVSLRAVGGRRQRKGRQRQHRDRGQRQRGHSQERQRQHRRRQHLQLVVGEERRRQRADRCTGQRCQRGEQERQHRRRVRQRHQYPEQHREQPRRPSWRCVERRWSRPRATRSRSADPAPRPNKTSNPWDTGARIVWLGNHPKI